MIMFDTTILVYAVGAEHPLRNPTRSMIEMVRDQRIQATTTVEVVQEFAHVRARRRSRADAASRASEFAVGLAPLSQPDEDDLLEGLELFRDTDALGPFDAVLAATARRRAWALASADRSFERVDGLLFLNPASPAFLDEVRAAG
jgi:hypothetical protein